MALVNIIPHKSPDRGSPTAMSCQYHDEIPPSPNDQIAIVVGAEQPHSMTRLGCPFIVVVLSPQMSGQGWMIAAARLARERTVART